MGVSFYLFINLFNDISKHISYLDISRFLKTYPDPEGSKSEPRPKIIISEQSLILNSNIQHPKKNDPDPEDFESEPCPKIYNIRIKFNFKPKNPIPKKTIGT